jgi:hypothetical protein
VLHHGGVGLSVMIRYVRFRGCVVAYHVVEVSEHRTAAASGTVSSGYAAMGFSRSVRCLEM